MNDIRISIIFTITFFIRIGCVTSKLNDISVIICIVVSYIIVTIFTSIGLVLHNTKPCLCLFLFCISLSFTSTVPIFGLVLHNNPPTLVTSREQRRQRRKILRRAQTIFRNNIKIIEIVSKYF